jgi:hypothetical protein
MSARTEKRIIRAHDKAVRAAETFAEAYQDLLNAFYELGHVTGFAGHPSTLPFPKPSQPRNFIAVTDFEEEFRTGWAGDDS